MTAPALDRLIAQLRPDRTKSPEDLVGLLQRFVSFVQSQRTVEPVDLRLDRNRDSPTVRGYVAYPAMLAGLEAVLEQTGLADLRTTVEVVPAGPDGGAPFRRSPARFEGRVSAAVEAEIVHIWNPGDPVRVLGRNGDWTLIQSEVGYLGWVDSEAKGLGDEEWKPPVSAELDAESWEQWAAPWLGTPYVWGGTSVEGVDCSGFVQAVYRSAGVMLPRDSHQQMLCGVIVATHDRRVPLAPGDLLFFTHEDGRVGHVGLSLGGWEVIHAEEPVAARFSLDPGSPSYNARRAEHFVLAKRVLVGR